MLLALLGLLAVAGTDTTTKVVVAPYDPVHPWAPTRAVITLRVQAEVPVPPPPAAAPYEAQAVPYEAQVPAPYAAHAPAPYADPPAPPPPVAPYAAPAPAPPPVAESLEVENPFAAARERYLAEQAAEAEAAIDRRVIGDGPIRGPRLSAPPAQRCLAARGSSGDGVQIEGRGLSPEQIRASLTAFLPKAANCLPEGSSGTFDVVAAFTVGCDGRVTEVELTQRDILPDEVVDCVEVALGYAPFPAHDRQGGALFEMPLSFTREP